MNIAKKVLIASLALGYAARS